MKVLDALAVGRGLSGFGLADCLDYPPPSVPWFAARQKDTLAGALELSPCAEGSTSAPSEPPCSSGGSRSSLGGGGDLSCQAYPFPCPVISMCII